MKMLRNIAAVSLAGLALVTGVTGCTDSFLDVSSKTQSNTGNYYKSVQDAEEALVGCYAAWRRTVSDGTWGFYYVSTLMSDECFAGTGTGDNPDYQVVDRFDQSRYSAGTSLLESSWDSYYRCIYRCNEVVHYDDINQFGWTEDQAADRGRLIGEAKALRALCYFEMVRMWENVPLLLEPVKDADVPQADPDDVYAAIISDFRYAADNIPADAYPRANKDLNDGKITRYAAAGMLARVYLYYTGYYGHEPEGLTKADVVGYLEDIISSNEYKLIDYKNLWMATAQDIAPDSYTFTRDDYNNGVNDETILQMKFNYVGNAYGEEEDKHGNRFVVMLGIRKGWAPPVGYGWGGCTVNPILAESYEENDVRRDLSLVDFNKEGLTSGGFKSSNNSFEDFLKDQREYTGYTIRKYAPTCFYNGKSTLVRFATKFDAEVVQEYQTNPFVILRYADVLLMAAELGGTPSKSAQEALDEVRSRADLPSVAPTLDNILEERRHEFAFEAIRYWDLLRQGVDKAASTIALENLKVLSGNKEDFITIKAENIKSKRGLMQIPLNQIIKSQHLKQNPGW